MLWLLRDYLKLDVKNMDSEDSTGVFVLQKLARTREDIALYLTLREKKKLVSSFYEAYKELQYQGKLHTSFHITRTRTGRLSSSDPNLQQVPDVVRPLLIPKDQDHIFVNYDLSAIEARLIACESGDPVLCDLIGRGLSPHDQNAKVFFGLKTPVEQVKKLHEKERFVAKTGGFSLYYGAGKNRLNTIFISNNIHKTEKEVAQILRDFRETYRGSFERHIEITESLAVHKLFNAFGRPIIVENPDDFYMKGYNAITQSLASDLCLFAAMRVQARFEKIGLDANVLLLVHDSILVEAHKKHAVRAEQILVQEMCRYRLTNRVKDVSLSVECEGGIVDHWQ